jgi:cysteine desulfurase/selenocysteine lyase
MNSADVIGMAAAIEYVEALGMDSIREHEMALAAYAIDRLTDVGAVVYGPKDMSQRGGAVAFNLDGVHPHDMATIVDQEGVCIRAGHHCAQPLMRRLGVPATARASLYIYNDERDVDALIDALAKAKGWFA